MAEVYFYVRGGQKHGPLSPEHVRQLVGTGFLTSVDMMLISSQGKWLSLGAIPELYETPIQAQPTDLVDDHNNEIDPARGTWVTAGDVPGLPFASHTQAPTPELPEASGDSSLDDGVSSHAPADFLNPVTQPKRTLLQKWVNHSGTISFVSYVFALVVFVGVATFETSLPPIAFQWLVAALIWILLGFGVVHYLTCLFAKNE